MILGNFFSFFFGIDQLVVPGVTVAKLSSMLNSYNALNAVDGNTNQDMGYCSHTGISKSINEAWLLVDLNKTYSIESVTFWYRKYLIEYLQTF